MAAPSNPHRVWVGNLSPALPRHVLAEQVQWLGLQVLDFALFHQSGGVNSAAVLAFGSSAEAQYAVTLLNGLVSPALCGAGASAPVKARHARGNSGVRPHVMAPSSNGGFSGGVIRLRPQTATAQTSQPKPPQPKPPSYPPPAVKRSCSPPTPPWRKKRTRVAKAEANPRYTT